MSIAVYVGVTTKSIRVVSYPRGVEVPNLKITVPQDIELNLPESIAVVYNFPTIDSMPDLP